MAPLIIPQPRTLEPCLPFLQLPPVSAKVALMKFLEPTKVCKGPGGRGAARCNATGAPDAGINRLQIAMEFVGNRLNVRP
jgi:hypothetical protein